MASLDDLLDDMFEIEKKLDKSTNIARIGDIGYSEIEEFYSSLTRILNHLALASEMMQPYLRKQVAFKGDPAGELDDVYVKYTKLLKTLHTDFPSFDPFDKR